jgi:predicted nucleic acid-binding protein
MIYLDTSYIIKCYVREPGSDAVLDLVENHPGRACSQHGRLEFWAAIHRHVRQGDLTLAQAQEIWRQFEADEKDSLWSWLPVTEEVLASACS